MRLSRGRVGEEAVVMRLRAGIWVCVCCIGLLFLACERRDQRRIVCGDFEQSQAAVLTFIGEIAQQIEQNSDPETVLKVVSETFKRDGASIDGCTTLIDEHLRAMTSDEVRSYHADFIAKAEVLRLLDAQDKFQERATAEQIEVIDEFLGKVFLLSE